MLNVHAQDSYQRSRTSSGKAGHGRESSESEGGEGMGEGGAMSSESGGGREVGRLRASKRARAGRLGDNESRDSLAHGGMAGVRDSERMNMTDSLSLTPSTSVRGTAVVCADSMCVKTMCAALRQLTRFAPVPMMGGPLLCWLHPADCDGILTQLCAACEQGARDCLACQALSKCFACRDTCAKPCWGADVRGRHMGWPGAETEDMRCKMLVYFVVSGGRKRSDWVPAVLRGTRRANRELVVSMQCDLSAVNAAGNGGRMSKGASGGRADGVHVPVIQQVSGLYAFNSLESTCGITEWSQTMAHRHAAGKARLQEQGREQGEERERAHFSSSWSNVLETTSTWLRCWESVCVLMCGVQQSVAMCRLVILVSLLLLFFNFGICGCYVSCLSLFSWSSCLSLSVISVIVLVDTVAVAVDHYQ